jgi:hypothetical protein
MISAEFFDIFGFLAFLILLGTGISLLKKAKKHAIIVIVISIIGLLVDGYIVISTYLIK